MSTPLLSTQKTQKWENDFRLSCESSGMAFVVGVEKEDRNSHTGVENNVFHRKDI